MAAFARFIAHGRFYYGWTIVAVGFTTQFVLVSLRFYGLSLFVKPMSDDLGWSRAGISAVLSFGTVVEGIVAPLVGPIIDKRGGRELMIFGAIISGAAYMALGLVHNLWDFYLLRGVVITVGLVCAGPLVISVAISNWFIRRRGQAMSLSQMGVSLGGAALSPVITYLILTYGWRMTWVVLGVAIWASVIPFAVLFMKRRPEDIGLLPDGDAVAGAGGQVTVLPQKDRPPSPDHLSGPRPPTPVPHAEVSWTRREAMRTSALWLTILAFGLGGMGGTAMGLHFFPYLTDLKLSPEAAAGIYSLYAMAITGFKPLWGFLIDKYDVRRSGILSFVSLALMQAILIVLPLWQSFWLICFAAIYAGFSMAGNAPVQEVIWANYFGRLSLGAIRSIASPFSIISSAGGPLLAGWVYDSSGSYQVAWAVFAVAYAIGGLFIYIARPPKKTLPALVSPAMP